MRLDAKSARKIAAGRIESEEKAIHEREKSLLAAHRASNKKLGKRSLRSGLEQFVRDTYGNTLIGFGWAGRAFISFFLEPIVDPDAPNRPVRLRIQAEQLNTRSDAMHGMTAAEISTHAIERLMERREEVDIHRICREEFDLAFLSKIIFGVDGIKLLPGQNFDIATTNGYARGVVMPNGIPLIATWIRARH